ncbi:uncharacterized protein BDV17DRAFT_293117 [Aspergillus undulatus]|uniref:uncharacterized protein n=1 Tax=Aspergillus undulatus TaxID=1810928 RepID=UPI003CCDA858
MSAFPVDRKAEAAVEYTDLAFVTSRPPDVPVRNRIVAVCGIFDADRGDQAASPQDDGFFFSDFYLFYHLLHPVNTHSMSQIWLTAESPEGLVEEYGELAHENPRGERRVVLDSALLPGIANTGNIRVVDPAMLLDGFVKTIQEQAKLAHKNSETLITLIFGHGQKGTFQIELGGDKKPGKPYLFFMDLLKRMLPRDTNITLLMTSCFSGGWLVQPRLSTAHIINVAGIAASGPDQQTRSWSLNKSIGRACGTTVASALLQDMIEVEDAGDTESGAFEHPTYMGFCHSIYTKAKALDRFINDQEIHFSAQDDEWEAQWTKRTGAPLRKDSYAVNVGVHNKIHRFFEHGPSGLGLEYAFERIKSRLAQMRDADVYMEAMGLEFPSCLSYSLEDDYHSSPELDVKTKKAFQLVASSRLIDEFVSPSFYKPTRVLAIALATNCSIEKQMNERLGMAFKFKAERARLVLPRVGASQIMKDPEVQERAHYFVAAVRDGYQHVPSPSDF